jgi:protein MAK11
MKYFHSAKNDKDYIVTGSEDKSVRIWDVESGECVSEIKAHKLRVKAVSVVECDDRIILCSVSSDGLIKCWDLEAALVSTENIEPLGEYNTKCRATCITSHVGFSKTEAIAAAEAAAEAEIAKEAKALKKAKDAAKKEAALEAKKEAEKKAAPPQKKKQQQQKKKPVAKK